MQIIAIIASNMNGKEYFMRILKTTVIALAMLAGACSSDSDDDSSCAKVYGYCFEAAEGVNVSGSTVTGSGNLNLGQVVDTAASGKNFQATVTLEDGDSVTLLAFADSSLENGVNIVFTRSGSTVEWVLAENSGTLKTSSFSDADATKELVINVDLHNDEEPAHVIIWEGTGALPEEDAQLKLTRSNWRRDIRWADYQMQLFLVS